MDLLIFCRDGFRSRDLFALEAGTVRFQKGLRFSCGTPASVWALRIPDVTQTWVSEGIFHPGLRALSCSARSPLLFNLQSLICWRVGATAFQGLRKSPADRGACSRLGLILHSLSWLPCPGAPKISPAQAAASQGLVKSQEGGGDIRGWGKWQAGVGWVATGAGGLWVPV